MNEATGGETRRLRAIMFTDMFGFLKMMDEDEQRTIRLVDEHRAIVRAIVRAVLPGPTAARRSPRAGGTSVTLAAARAGLAALPTPTPAKPPTP